MKTLTEQIAAVLAPAFPTDRRGNAALLRYAAEVSAIPVIVKAEIMRATLRQIVLSEDDENVDPWELARAALSLADASPTTGSR